MAFIEAGFDSHIWVRFWQRSHCFMPSSESWPGRTVRIIAIARQCVSTGEGAETSWRRLFFQ